MGCDSAIGNKLLNARCETVAQKPSFHSAFWQRRCLIPASGFYEWQKTGAGRKQPYFIRPCDGGLFALAGLWERWHDPRGEAVETYTIVTTEANELMRSLHKRMPVILDLASEEVWLDPRASADALRTFFVPFASDQMQAVAVGSWVSNPGHEGAQRLEPSSA